MSFLVSLDRSELKTKGQNLQKLQVSHPCFDGVTLLVQRHALVFFSCIHTNHNNHTNAAFTVLRQSTTC